MYQHVTNFEVHSGFNQYIAVIMTRLDICSSYFYLSKHAALLCLTYTSAHAQVWEYSGMRVKYPVPRDHVPTGLTLPGESLPEASWSVLGLPCWL